MSVIWGSEIVKSGLMICVDAANTNSYAGTGTTIRDIVSNTQSTSGFINGATFNSEFGGNFVFDGTNDYIVWGATSAISNNFTVDFWFRPTTTHEIDSETTSGVGGTSNQRYLIGAGSGGTNAYSGVSAGTNGISVYEHGNAYMPALLVYNSTISSTLFTHGIVTYTNKQPRLYVNGVLVRTGLTSPRSTVYGNTSYIGSGDYGAFPGRLAIYKVYNRPLTAAEVLQNYNAHKARFGL